jgi:RNA polymerase sigma-70 factor (ECF subfamily)
MRDPADLIRLYCRDGDAEAFRAFYRAQSPRLWKFLVARGCPPEDAYDLVSEAFIRFIQTVCRDPHAPRAFLYRIAANLRIDAVRRARARPTEPLSEETAGDADLPAQETAAHLRELVARLPEREQNLLLLRYWIGLSHQEVAQALDLPEGTVRRQCAELVAKLREYWGEDETRSTD